MSAIAIPAPLAPPGWVPPGWMRCSSSCRLVLELDEPGPGLVVDLVGDRLRCRAALPLMAVPGPEPDEQATVRTSGAFVSAWFTDPDVLLGDALGTALELQGQLFLVSLFDGAVGQFKAAAAAAAASSAGG